MSALEQAVQQLVAETVKGLIPQIIQAVQQAGTGVAAVGNVQQAAVQQAAVQQSDPFGGLGNQAQQAAVQQQVTAEMVQSLITPLIANEAMKAQLSAAMNAMGIMSLPDARPEQLGELYSRFQAVANGTYAQVYGSAISGAQQAVQQQAATTGGGVSII